jgi:hypothetical protein
VGLPPRCDLTTLGAVFGMGARRTGRGRYVSGRRLGPQSSDSIEQAEPVTDCYDAKLLQGLVRQARKNRGKMNHIQWVRLFPAVSSSTTRAYTEACASTKRTRSGSVTRAAWVHGHALFSAPMMAKICAYSGRFAFSEAENGQTAAVTLCRLHEIVGG